MSIEVVAMSIPAVGIHFDESDASLKHLSSLKHVPPDLMFAISLDVSRRKRRYIKQLLAFHQRYCGIEHIRVGLRHLFAPALTVPAIGSVAKLLASLIS